MTLDPKIQDQIYVLQYAVENLYAVMRREGRFGHEATVDEINTVVDETLSNSPMCDPETIIVD